jgi:AcrR family transcriptional regulator
VTVARGPERALEGRRRKYEAEVEQLVAAAFAVMRATGTASPTVADILAEAGLSTATFYRHFPTKDDLLVTLLERAHERTRAHLESLLAAEERPADRVTAWVRGLFDLPGTDDRVAANRPFLLAHPRLLERFPDEIGAGIERLVALLADAIAAARAEARLPPGDPAGDARLAFHQVFGMLVDHAALRTTTTPTTVSRVAGYTLRAVLAPPGRVRSARSSGR